MLGGQGIDRPASLDYVAHVEPRRRRASLDRSRARVVDAAVAGAHDLAVLVADRAPLVRTDGAERGQRAVALADHDVGLLVARVGVRGGLAGGEAARRAEADGAA